MADNRTGDCVLAILPEPDLAVSLTCTAPGSWRTMIFEFATKKVVYADEKNARLAEAQQHVLDKIAQLYGHAPTKVAWRASNTTRGDGPSG